MATCEDTYYPPERMTIPGFVIDVRHPILSAEERERRLSEIKKAAARLILSSGG